MNVLASTTRHATPIKNTPAPRTMSPPSTTKTTPTNAVASGSTNRTQSSRLRSTPCSVPGTFALAYLGRPTAMADEFKKGDKVVWSSHGKDDTPGVVRAQDHLRHDRGRPHGQGVRRGAAVPRAQREGGGPGGP